MKKFFLLNIVLNLFDGGGAAAGGDGAGAAASGQGDNGNKGGSQATPGNTRRGKAGEYQNVLFGKQQSAAAGGSSTQEGPSAPSSDAGSDNNKQGVITTSNTLEERQKAYREFVNSPEYKDLYTEDTQRIINRRFRETQNLQQQVGQYQPIIDMLAQRYKIADGDMTKLAAAIENDNAYWSAAAEEAGMDVEQFKKFQQLQRREQELTRQLQAREGRDAAQKQLQKWYTEGEQLKKLYPSFDLETEADNPQFRAMLKSGVPVQHAYEVIHMEQIKAGVAAMQAKATEKQVVDGIRAKGARPQENGTSAQSAFTVKDDPSKWSKKDRAEVIRRVQRGETIYL